MLDRLLKYYGFNKNFCEPTPSCDASNRINLNMIMIDLTASELFESLMDFKTSEGIIDLHNDYECQKILYEKDMRCLKVIFKGKNTVIINFQDVQITKINWLFERTSDSSILDLFYRGRFEVNGQLYELTEEGRSYFYLNFIEGDAIELFAAKVYLSIHHA